LRPPSGGVKRAGEGIAELLGLPRVAVVPVGGTVEFPNQDPVFHNVFPGIIAGDTQGGEGDIRGQEVQVGDMGCQGDRDATGAGPNIRRAAAGVAGGASPPRPPGRGQRREPEDRRGRLYPLPGAARDDHRCRALEPVREDTGRAPVTPRRLRAPGRRGEALARLVDFVRDLTALKDQSAPKPPVNIIAHSMGGLIVRELLQVTLPGLGRRGDECINKIVTLGTPHRGISFQGIRDWKFTEAEEELERFNPDAQADRSQQWSFVNFSKYFPPERVLCVVGTNYRSYTTRVATALNRLYLHTLDWNERAQRGFRKAGFSSCGTSWRDGHTFVIMEVWRQAVEAEAPRQAVAS